MGVKFLIFLQKKLSLGAFIQSLKVDLVILSKDIKAALIDTCIWVILSIFCNGYVLPRIGLTTSFGALLALGHVVSCGIFLSYSATMIMTKDLEGEGTIKYELMLPMPAWMVLLKKALAWAAKAFILSSIILPLAKIVLWNRISFSEFCLVKFCLSFLLINLFAGVFSIFSLSINKNILSINSVWVRLIYPMWYLGGSIFPYKIISENFWVLGKILLFNPMVYSTEMIRFAVLGSSSAAIPFWVSFFALSFFTVMFFFIAFLKLRKKLDFV